jgi:hypothetical protein
MICSLDFIIKEKTHSTITRLVEYWQHQKAVKLNKGCDVVSYTKKLSIKLPLSFSEYWSKVNGFAYKGHLAHCDNNGYYFLPSEEASFVKEKYLIFAVNQITFRCIAIACKDDSNFGEVYSISQNNDEAYYQYFLCRSFLEFVEIYIKNDDVISYESGSYQLI